MSSPIEIDISELLKVEKAFQRVAKSEVTTLLSDIGSLLEDSARERVYDTKESPEGAPWADWSERYALTRGPQHSFLYGKGDLLDSLTHQVSGDVLEVGATREYAATHQYGDEDRNIPARPYLGISEEDKDDIISIVGEWFEKNMEGGR